jgi:soluble lytic murein transglycosylase-like protein
LSILLLLVVSCAQSNVTLEPRPPSTDAVLNLYRSEHFRPVVLEFYSHLTASATVAQAILTACDDLGVAPSLAFALAWNESQFNPLATNYNEASVDRGLFQLNSRTFPKLTKKAFFDPDTNAHLGLKYLKNVLDKLGTPAKALGYYNAGIGLLTDRPLPRSTQSYIVRILEDQKSMDSDAIAWLYFSHEPRVALK